MRVERIAQDIMNICPEKVRYKGKHKAQMNEKLAKKDFWVIVWGWLINRYVLNGAQFGYGHLEPFHRFRPAKSKPSKYFEANKQIDKDMEAVIVNSNRIPCFISICFLIYE